jgi:hypothetical protein
MIFPLIIFMPHLNSYSPALSAGKWITTGCPSGSSLRIPSAGKLVAALDDDFDLAHLVVRAVCPGDRGDRGGGAADQGKASHGEDAFEEFHDVVLPVTKS